MLFKDLVQVWSYYPENFIWIVTVRTRVFYQSLTRFSYSLNEQGERSLPLHFVEPTR